MSFIYYIFGWFAYLLYAVFTKANEENAWKLFVIGSIIFAIMYVAAFAAVGIVDILNPIPR